MNYGKNATKRRVQKVDKKSTKVRHKFGVFFWKFILILVIIIGVVGISSGVGIMKGIIDSSITCSLSKRITIGALLVS